jgi:(hydroxyamino)benzene mutase
MESSTVKQVQSNRLIFLGIFLFLLGLLVGLFVPLLANPRMGLSSHLEGVMNGMFLVMLGLLWHKVDLSNKWLNITYWLAIYGTFANWLGILVAAIFDAGEMLGIAAQGKKGPVLAEAFVTFCLVSLSLSMLFICVTILMGLKRSIHAPGQPH